MGNIRKKRIKRRKKKKDAVVRTKTLNTYGRDSYLDQERGKDLQSEKETRRPLARESKIAESTEKGWIGKTKRYSYIRTFTLRLGKDKRGSSNYRQYGDGGKRSNAAKCPKVGDLCVSPWLNTW